MVWFLTQIYIYFTLKYWIKKFALRDRTKWYWNKMFVGTDWSFCMLLNFLQVATFLFYRVNLVYFSLFETSKGVFAHDAQICAKRNLHQLIGIVLSFHQKKISCKNSYWVKSYGRKTENVLFYVLKIAIFGPIFLPIPQVTAKKPQLGVIIQTFCYSELMV